jgi:hypothetical protein
VEDVQAVAKAQEMLHLRMLDEIETGPQGGAQTTPNADMDDVLARNYDTEIQIPLLHRSSDTDAQGPRMLVDVDKISSFTELGRVSAQNYTLNTLQTLALQLVCRFLDRYATDPDSAGQHFQYTGGPGGTGKSRVVEALKWVFSARGQSHLLRITGTSGSAAAHIGGTTLHSACGLDTRRSSDKKLPLFSEAKKWMWKQKLVLVIDEVSMLGGATLYEASCRLQSLRDCPDQPFGPFGHHHDDRNVSPSTRSNITHSFHQTPSSKHGPAIISQAGSFMNKLPMRNSQQPPPQWSMINDLGAPQQPDLVEDSLPVNSTNSVHTPSTSIGVDIMPSANGSSRRSSVLPKYSHVVGNGMYTQHGQPGSAAPNAQANYSNKQNGLTQSFVTTVPATPPQSYMGNSSVDTMTRPGYDPYHGHVYHARDITSGQVGQQSNYNSISSDGRGLQTPPDVSKVIDSVPRVHME